MLITISPFCLVVAVPVDLNKKIEAAVTIGETADDTEIMPENGIFFSF